MKNVSVIFLLLFSFYAFGQKTFKTRYFVKSSVIFKDNDTLKLKKEETVKFENLTLTEQKEIRKKYEGITSVTYTVSENINGKTVQRTVTEDVNEEFFKNQSKLNTIDAPDFQSAKANVLLKDDGKLYVNTFSIKNKGSNDNLNNNEVYYYQLKDRKTLGLWFIEGTVSTFAIPIKYRFRDEDTELQEDFSSSFNVNLFVGVSFGQSKFTYREKIDNKTNTWKLTGGLVLGTSTVNLDKSNTSLADIPLGDDAKITKGLASVGYGITYSFNEFNLGLFLGRDYAIGKDSDKWNYNKKLWLGFGIGYSLFKI